MVTSSENGFRVALVCMPFSMADRPSIQIGLLASIAERAGFPTDTLHLNLELAARLPDCYEGLCSHRGRMTGEWLFSVAAFGDQIAQDDQPYYDAFPEELAWAAKGGKDAKFLTSLRHELLPQFIEDCAGMVDWGRYAVVGFTSTFQQNTASLALARRIKKRFPSVRIVIGGANMEDEMGPEFARAFPFVDHVVVGEGDVLFPELLQRIAKQGSLKDLVGVTSRDGSKIHFHGAATPVRDMDDLPTPRYEEYFQRHRELGLNYRKEAIFAVPFESSRGCWWGEKHHCTFCGLNGLGMNFRAKKPARALAELSELASRHGVTMFQATDNILDMKYLKDFFVEIETRKTDYQFFYETKSNLTQEQIRALRRGGVRWLQPGIESLNTHVLSLMRKGCSMLQNLRTLKWCLYYRIRTGWNLIWGFPGEHAEDYQREFEVLKLISHLEPPHSCGRIWMERFSPVFFDREAFPVRSLRPEASYRHAYPDYVDLTKVAYFFEYSLENTLPDEVHRPTQKLVEEWKQQWNGGQAHTLFYRRTMDAVLVDDNRGPERKGTHVLHGPVASLYEFCSPTMHTVQQISQHLGGEFSETEVQSTLEELCGRGLMVGEEGSYLSLALPANGNW